MTLRLQGEARQVVAGWVWRKEGGGEGAAVMSKQKAALASAAKQG